MHLSPLTLLLFALCLSSISILIGVGIALMIGRGASKRREDEINDEKRSLERKLADLKDTVIQLRAEAHAAQVKLPAEVNQLRQERDQLAVQLKMFEENYRTLAQQSRSVNERLVQGQREYESLKHTYNEHVTQLQRMNHDLQAKINEIPTSPEVPAETTILRSFPAPHVDRTAFTES